MRRPGDEAQLKCMECGERYRPRRQWALCPHDPRREISAPDTPRANSNGDGRRKRRTAKASTTKPGIPAADGLTPCPRCGQRWPELHRIFDTDDEDSVAELACEACVFDDVYAGRVSLRRRAHPSPAAMQTPEDD